MTYFFHLEQFDVVQSTVWRVCLVVFLNSSKKKGTYQKNHYKSSRLGFREMLVKVKCHIARCCSSKSINQDFWTFFSSYKAIWCCWASFKWVSISIIFIYQGLLETLLFFFSLEKDGLKRKNLLSCLKDHFLVRAPVGERIKNPFYSLFWWCCLCSIMFQGKNNRAYTALIAF